MSELLLVDEEPTVPRIKVFACDMCDDEHDIVDLIQFGEALLCDGCIEGNTVSCNHCGDQVWNHDACSDVDMDLCPDCYDRHYYRCSDCECIVRQDDALHYNGYTLCNALARESEVRGSHATGVACVSDGAVKIFKEAKPASKLSFQLSKDVLAVMGHTRHATQGSEKDNWNNHPFIGRIGRTQFALAHNGIIHNDYQLRRDLKLPHTKIETDSYIGVQLLETQKDLSLQSHRYMAERIQGSFTFTTIDQYNNLYIAKGNSPISIIHFMEIGLFVYASTDEILWNSMMNTSLFSYIKKILADGHSRKIEFSKLEQGEIMNITANGIINRCNFDYSEYEFACDWYDYQSPYGRRFYGSSYYSQTNILDYETNDLDDLLQVAAGMGIEMDDVLTLYDMGLDRLEIEDLIYDPDALHEYLSDI